MGKRKFKWVYPKKFMRYEYDVSVRVVEVGLNHYIKFCFRNDAEKRMFKDRYLKFCITQDDCVYFVEDEKAFALVKPATKGQSTASFKAIIPREQVELYRQYEGDYNAEYDEEELLYYIDLRKKVE